MHLIEAYANHVGVKLDSTPVPPVEKFYPITGNYITIQGSSGFGSKNYSYYNEVLKYIKTILNKQDIRIAQIGLKDDPVLGVDIDLRGKTNFAQCAYVVKHSLCHVGNDSVWAHVANSFARPIVVLFGPTLSKVSGPYFNNSNIKVLESDRGGRKAALSLQDPNNTINLIKPEDVANSIFEILNIEDRIEIETFLIGKLFSTPILEVDLSKDLLINVNPQIELNLRLDWDSNLDRAYEICKKNNVSLIANAPIDINFLKGCRDKISQIIYEIDLNADIEYIKFLFGFGKTKIMSALKGEELSQLKLKLFDYFPVLEKNASELKINEKGLLFKNNGGVLSGDRKYPTKWHLDNEIYSETGEYEFPETEEQSFLLYQEFLHTYKKTV